MRPCARKKPPSKVLARRAWLSIAALVNVAASAWVRKAASAWVRKDVVVGHADVLRER